MREVFLGGDVRSRRLFRGNRSDLEWGLLLVAFLLAGASLLSKNTLLIGAGILLFAAAVWWLTPTKSKPLSPAARQGRRWYYRWRRAVGLTSFGQAEPVKVPWFLPRPKVTGNAPWAVGDVRWFTVTFRGGGSMVIFRHTMPGSEEDYFSVVLEVQGTTGALRSERNYEQPYIRWGEALTAMADEQSLVHAVQEIAHVMPADITDHLASIGAQLPDPYNELLVASYANLAEKLKTRSDNHRTFVALVFKSSAKLWKRASRSGGGDAGVGTAIWREVQRAVSKLNGPFSSIRVLDESRVAALIKGLQDPDIDIDVPLDGGLAQCWVPFTGDDPEQLLVNEKWFTRTARIEGRKIATKALPVQTLAKLISSENDSFIRTVSAFHVLVPQDVARGEAQTDVTVDKGSADAESGKGHIGDGSHQAALSGSQARLLDLQVGQPYQGVRLGLHITVKARDQYGLDEAVESMSGMAKKAGISSVDWLDERQDLAFLNTLPLGRGVRL